MPRADFDILSEAEEFLKRKIIPSDKLYEGYHTKSGSLNLIPGKSTSPKLYVFIKKADEGETRKLFKGTGIPIYKCSNFEWNAEHMPTKVVD